MGPCLHSDPIVVDREVRVVLFGFRDRGQANDEVDGGLKAGQPDVPAEVPAFDLPVR